MQDDSVVGILSFKDTSVQINASWSYSIKNRMYIFEFGNGLLWWDDNTKSILYGADILEIDSTSPLHNSINEFMKSPSNKKEFTIQVTKILEGIVEDSI